jgi:hypothetical protein
MYMNAPYITLCLLQFLKQLSVGNPIEAGAKDLWLIWSELSCEDPLRPIPFSGRS